MISGLSKANNGRGKFSGNWEGNSKESIVLYESPLKLCKLSDHEMSNGPLIMFTGYALTFYVINISSHAIYMKNEGMIVKLNRRGQELENFFNNQDFLKRREIFQTKVKFLYSGPLI